MSKPEPKLGDVGATIAGATLAETALAIQQRFDLTDGDLIALITVAFTSVVELKIGRASLVYYLRDHADELETTLLQPCAIPPLRERPN